MPDTRIRVPEELYNQIKALAGQSGKSEAAVLNDIIKQAEGEGKTLEEIVDEMEPAPLTRTTTRRRTPRYRTINIPAAKTDPLDRVAEKMEKILGIQLMNKLISDMPLSPSEKAALKTPYGTQQPATRPEKKNIMEFVTELKALESLDKQTSDPEVKAMLKELKDARVKDLAEAKTKPSNIAYDDERRKRLDDLKEYALMTKMFGGPEAQKEADKLWRSELTQVKQALHQTQLGIKDTEIARLTREKADLEKLPRTPADIAAAALKLIDQDIYVKAAFKEKVKQMGLTTDELSLEKKAKIATSLIQDIIGGVQQVLPTIGKTFGGAPPGIPLEQVPAPQPLSPEQVAALEQAKIPSVTETVKIEPPVKPSPEIRTKPTRPKPSEGKA